ncbi:hypothetical protein [Pacificispira sp.]|uniref:hypothetical protein n=1 Tax=Pacificispira sp. TaxID=2888761 RepID=UPI003B51CE34
MQVSADAILEGYRLSVVLEPDPSAGTYLESLSRYVECYPLLHVVAQGEDVWGATRRTHGLVDDSGNLTSQLGFIYTNALPIYVLYNSIDDPADSRSSATNIKINSAAQYRVMDFVLRESGAPVWDHREPQGLSALEESIRAGNDHFIVTQDAEGTVRSNPLDLVFVYQDKPCADFRVVSAHLPAILQDPVGFSKRLVEMLGGEAPLDDPDFTRKGSVASINPYGIITTDEGKASHTGLKVPANDFREVRVFAVT